MFSVLRMLAVVVVFSVWMVVPEDARADEQGTRIQRHRDHRCYVLGRSFGTRKPAERFGCREVAPGLWVWGGYVQA